MHQDNQHDIWNPFCERIDSLSVSERVEIEIARAWSYYINGGGGEPYFFDHQSWLKMQQRGR